MYILRKSKYLIYVYVLDLFALAVAFSASYAIRFGLDSHSEADYLTLLLVIFLAQLGITNVFGSFTDFFERGYLREIKAILIEYTLILAAVFSYMFLEQTSGQYSRMTIIFFYLGALALSFLLRVWFKSFIMKRYRATLNGSKVMIVCTSDNLPEIAEKITNRNFWDYSFTSVAVIDQDRVGEEFHGIKIVANRDTLFDVTKTQVLDEILLHLGYRHPDASKIITGFEQMGITVHYVLANLEKTMPNPRIEKFSGFTVLTTSSNIITHTALVIKRLMDVFGALVGLIFTGIVSIFLVPAIKIESRGPAVYTQTRIGRNGRPFKIYKFRSMYRDADARKKDLLAQNEMQGHMFKLEDDPRVTKVGKFIRKTSLDEFPQFFNVLKGEMSLVGTRPPTEDEFIKYSLHHKSRLSFKPGITGMWQVSGRSNITDFEEIVALDSAYIQNWSLRLDIKIIMKTILNVLSRKGAK